MDLEDEEIRDIHRKIAWSVT